MRCSRCATDNPPGAKFCNECAAPLPLQCSSCGTENPAGAKFCNECATPLTKGATAKRGNSSTEGETGKWEKGERGRKTEAENRENGESGTAIQPPVAYTPAYLAERIQAEREAMEARGVSDGERKSITALFVDIKDSTDLIAELDPEEARAILDPTLQLMMDAVHRYEGYVAQALGDGIFALFGAPIAHEDHPQRALYAALLMQEESRKRAERLRKEKGINLQLRVGVNTGEVVLRSIRKDDLHADYVPVGQSTHLASRMESLATPGSILVSEQTYRLTEGYFAFNALGEAQIKGFAEPLHIYEVTGVGPLRTKLQLSVRRGLARFVGRQHEMALLQHALEQAKAGHGQIAAVMGEPGVGKSRLFYEFKLLSQRGCLVLETFSVSHGKAYPYLPLIDLLKNYFQLTNQDDERRRREKITGKVLTLDRGLEDTIPYLAFLLGIVEPTSPLQQMDPQIRRKRILEAIKRLLLRESLNQPLIIIFEDLHWLDAETQAFLQLLSESVATARILLLVNYRPEYQPQWSGKTYFSQLRLGPLGKEQAEEMLMVLLDNALESSLPQWDRPVLSLGERAREKVTGSDLSALKRFILDKTEGNPFFMEEIVQTLRERGILTDPRKVGTAHQYSDLRLPTTVQGVLSARMDRLPAEEKALLQTLAVIGREFSSGLLHQVVTEQEEALQRMLTHLQAAEFVYEQPAFPDVEYVFKHALTQEVAYNSLLIERRKVLHERTAQAMEEVFRSRLDDHYSELAYHYSRSGNTQKAIDYLQLAGEQSVWRSANTEAISYLTAALDLLKMLPETPERNQREIKLQVLLGTSLAITKGLAATEVEQVYRRAWELCQQGGETSEVFQVLFGLRVFYVQRANLKRAHELAQRGQDLALRQQDPALLLLSHLGLGVVLFWLGELSLAQEQMERGFASYTASQYGSLAFRYTIDVGVGTLSYRAIILWLLGYPQQALKESSEALRIAHDQLHLHSQAYAFATCQSWIRCWRREHQAVQQSAEAAIALSTTHGFPLFLGWGEILRGWALTEQGHSKEGVAQLQQGLLSWQATGAEAGRSYCLALQAETLGNVGRVKEGLSVLSEAIAHVQRTSERFYEAELYRLKGELILQRETKEPGAESTEQGAKESEGLGVRSEEHTLGSQEQRARSNEQEAEACFLKAIAISRTQQAKSLELRAVMSLVRLRQQQAQGHATRSTQHESRAKLEEAHQMLSEVYNWFTEGFDTKDLQEAKALLEELVAY